MHVIETVTDGSPLTELPGEPYGAGVSLILVDTDEDGAGPALHQHPYSETFVIRAGQALFTVAGRTLVGHAGQILVVPPFTPHKFAKTGPDRLEMLDIHASSRFVTEWLEEDPA